MIKSIIYLPLILISLRIVLGEGTSCDNAISVTWEHSNSDCQRICESLGEDSLEFKTSCGILKIKFENGAFGVSGCYSRYVYGYSENESNRLTVGYKSMFGINTPQQCQEECWKEYPKCINFLWIPEKLAVGKPLCYLKNIDYIKGSWKGSSMENVQYCNILTTDLCKSDPTYKCAGENTCIWCSPNHLSGPPLCGKDLLEDVPKDSECGDFHPVEDLPVTSPIPPQTPSTSTSSSTTTTEKPSTSTSSTTTTTKKPSTSTSSTTTTTEKPSTSTSSTTTTTEKPSTSTSSTIPPIPEPTESKEENSSSVIPIVGATAGIAGVLAIGGFGAYSFFKKPIEAAPIGDFENEALSEENMDRDIGVILNESDYEN